MSNQSICKATIHVIKASRNNWTLLYCNRNESRSDFKVNFLSNNVKKKAT